jgi:hypothetical protein
MPMPTPRPAPDVRSCAGCAEVITVIVALLPLLKGGRR